ncbi:hypothetical protein GCM10020000_53220 [Streptomyces olivoverticillatus]
MRPDPGASSLYAHVPFRQDTSYLAIGERTNANGSKAFREAMTEERWDDCVEIARNQIRDGAHLLDLCVDYVGRDGVADMRTLAGLFATASTLPIVLDSTEPAVLEAGLECLGGRAVINSVNYEDGDGPDSRFARIMPLAVEHGAAVVALTIDERGQARTAEWKLAVAERLIADLTGNWGGCARATSSSTASPSPSPPGRRRPGATASRRSRPSASSSAATPRCRPPSACRTSPSASTRPRGSCSTPSSSASAWPPGWTPPSPTPRRSCPSPASRPNSWSAPWT